MKKSCCIDDVNITPRNSSCSMVLRSDCSHGSCRKSLMVTTKQGESHQKEKIIDKLSKRKLSESDTPKSSLEINSYLRSSLKKLAYKSAETYSVLKESFYNRYEHFDYQNNNSLNGIRNLQNCDKEGYSLSSLTSPLNNNSIFQKECSYINNNCITSTYSEIMSRSRDFSRSKSTANVLSDSENEDGSLQDKVRKRRSNRTVSSKLRSSTDRAESLVSNNSNHVSTKSFNSANHADCKLVDSSYISSNYHTPSSSVVYNNNFKYNSGSDNSYSPSSISPVIDISSVQYTPVDRFRWFLWRSIYLKIIKCVNFDVWLLSRLHKYRRFILLLLLLPLLLYILYGLLLDESRNNSLSDLSSNVIAFPSYLYSIMSSPFSHSRDISSSEEESSCSTKFSDILYYVFFGIAQFLSNCITSIGKMFSLNSKQIKPDTVILTKSAADKEDVKSIAIEVLEERLNDVVIKIQESQRSHNAQSLKEDSIIKIQNDITKLRLEFQSLVEAVQKLENDFTSKSKGSFLKYDNLLEEHGGHITSINTKMEEFEGKLSTLNGVIKSCCDDKWTISDFTSSFEKHFLKALKNIVDRGNDQNSPYYFFHEWLHSKIESEKDSLAKELKLEFGKFETTGKKYDENIQKMVENIVQKHIETLKKSSHTFSNIGFSSEDTDISIIQKLIKEAIMLYDADKTGQVDYALESGGGSVLSTRCSESYAEKYGTISVLGFPLWSTHNSPRTAIQPDMQPGQCWAFKGSRGFLVIQLAYTIHPTGFTLEHIPVSLSPSGSIDSAPREFSVWGLTSEKDNDGKSLGNYTYDQDGEPLQYFPVQNLYDEPFSFVELRINSNHGNLDYTCLYRFRVHGKQPKD